MVREDIVQADLILLFHSKDEPNAMEIENHLRYVDFPRVGKAKVAMVEQHSLLDHLQDVRQSVDRGAVILALLTPSFMAKNMTSNAVYQLYTDTIMNKTHRFVPVYLKNVQMNKRVFSIYKGIYWNPNSSALLYNTLEHHIIKKYPCGQTNA